MSRQRESLTIFTGPMNSSKTRRLLDYLSEARDALGYSIDVYKPAKDNRYDSDEIRCRNGGCWSAIPVPASENGYSSSLFIIDDIFRRKDKPKPDLIAIDEVQFFDDDIKDVVHHLLHNQIEIAVSGLNRDFRGESFPAIESLMPMATRIETLTARCTYKNGGNRSCGAPATMSLRLIDGLPASYTSPTIIIEGDAESQNKFITYEARCLDHWSCPDIPQSRLQVYLNNNV